mmetsp:Transcript_3811/g.8159  ORF Transcript_3811/g.8159 Transcript_3811/m.8159 type:complete len:627 (+) Transcript_3811:89-1969(+)
MEEISRSSCCCCDQRRRRRCRTESSRKRGSLITVALLLLSALLPSTIASSSTRRLRGKKKSIYRGIPQHGAQRPSIPSSQHDEQLRRLILIASSSRDHADTEKEEARRKLVNILDTTDQAADSDTQQHRELAKKGTNKKTSNKNKLNKNKLTKQQRQRIKRLNAQRKKKNAERKKKKQLQQLLNQQSKQQNAKNNNNNNDDDKKQTDGKFTFGPPPKEKPKPQNSAGSISAYTSGNSMADVFVNSLASNFVSDESGGGGGGPSPTPPTPRPPPPKDEEEEEDDGGDDIQEASAGSYTITQGSLVPSLKDTSTQIDGFEKASKLNWEFSKTYPWKVTNDVSYEGKSSLMSGLPPSSANVVVGKSLYSNMTLSLDNQDLIQAANKNGAVLSFQVKATEALSWPISAFMVTLNDKIVLSPSDVESSASILWEENEWAEFSVVIDAVDSSSANYDIKFIHVANPLGLDKLPNVPAALELYMDDVRLAPFTRKSDSLDMTTSGSNGAKWKELSGVFVASSESVNQQNGHADLTSVVYSKLGGRLKYELKTSTQGPFDDLSILFNGKLQDAQFGQSANFEFVQMEIPRGKVVITFRHRKNPGQLSAGTLDKLGTTKTDGTNRVKNIACWLDR